MRRFVAIAAACALLLAACGGDDDVQPTVATAAADTLAIAPTSTTVAPASSAATPTTTTQATTTTTLQRLVPLEELQLALEVVADGFQQPVFMASPPGDRRRFVVDQPGIVWLIDEGDPEVFLDIRDQVRFRGEQGLLGLAFAPDHSVSGRFYVNYTTGNGSTRISEFIAGDAGSERVLLEIPQPANNHNGGMLAFGPEGHLWIGMGDGGSRDDRFRQAQDGSTLLGSLLRIDPAGDPYAIPADNPGGNLAAEVWAIGMRNPWRFSFDGADLWIGDVGQDRWEEIDRIDVSQQGGANFGWPLFEGSNCYLSNCEDTGLIAPVYEYEHAEGCSVTGGYVYRGAEIPELDGHYLFGDFCQGWIRGLTPSGDVIDWFGPQSVSGLSSFGVDAAGEVYVTSTDGTLYRVVRG